MRFQNIVIMIRDEVLPRLPKNKIYPNFEEELMERLTKIYEILMRGFNNG